MTTTIIIHNKATMKANGVHTSRNNKPVICIDNGKRYASVSDAAESMGVSVSNLSNCLNGKQATRAGLRWSFVSHVTENADAILDHTAHLSSELEKANAKLAAQESEMAEFRAWKLEQEKIRKAKETHQLLIDKANARLEHCKAAEQAAYKRYMFKAGQRAAAEENLAALQAKA